MSLTPDIELIRFAEQFCAAMHPNEQAEINRDDTAERPRWRAAAHVTCFDAAQRFWPAFAALVEQAKGDHLAAFLAQLPGDLFSETEIQRVREWAGEWSG